MREITIQVGKHDPEGVHTMRELERHLFPGELVEASDEHGPMLVISGDRADYVMDLLRICTEDPAFENFTEWKARCEAQGELNLDDYAPSHPVHATAG